MKCKKIGLILLFALMMFMWFSGIVISSGISNLIDDNNVVPVFVVIIILMMTSLWMFNSITRDIANTMDPKPDDKKE